jgi:lactoylglutathione lyase
MRMSALLLAIGFTLVGSPLLKAAEPSPRLSYVALNVLDEKRSLDFYVGILGMSERRRIVPNAAFKEILLGFTQSPNDPGVLLVVRASRDKPYEIGDGFSRFILNVGNLDAMAKHLADAGIKFVRPITEVKDPPLRYAMLKDPDGYLIELVQPTQ